VEVTPQFWQRLQKKKVGRKRFKIIPDKKLKTDEGK
jgi:hypothetical protein